jgi:predicted nucleic acid-binding Zn ribbon protein
MEEGEQLSPIDFCNSVHHTATGYLSMATCNRGISRTVSAGEWIMAAGKRPKGNLEPLAQLMGTVLRGTGLQKRFAEYRAVEAWDEVVGSTVAEQAQATVIRGGVLFVDVKSSVWMQELQLLRGDIIERLNAHLEQPFVKSMVLSIERSPYPGAGSPRGSSYRDRG